MPMKKHEMVYVFYKKLPLYDLSSHSHKFLKNKEESYITTTLYSDKKANLVKYIEQKKANIIHHSQRVSLKKNYVIMM